MSESFDSPIYHKLMKNLDPLLSTLRKVLISPESLDITFFDITERAFSINHCHFVHLIIRRPVSVKILRSPSYNF